MWHHRGISQPSRGCGCVASGHHSSLSSEILPHFISNIMWHFTCWYPGSMFSIPFSQVSKAIHTSFISLHMASHHKVSPFSSSDLFASAVSRGTLIPNLWFLVQYLDLVFAMIWFLFFVTKGTHHAKAGSCEIRDSTAYSVTFTGNDYFMSFRVTHLVEPSFHCTRISQPLVVSFRLFVTELAAINASWCFTSFPS